MVSSMHFVLAGITIARGVETSGLSLAETGVRRSVKSDVVEVTAVGPIKRQSPSEDAAVALSEEQPESSQLRCKIAVGSAPALGGDMPWLGNGEYTIHSYEKVVGAQDCALLCASDAKCKSFYHVKNSSHMLYQQCTLTSWAGHLDKFTPNECCDSGFPCSTDELMEKPNVFPVRALTKAPSKHRHHAKDPSSKTGDKTSPQDPANDKEIQRLNHALDIRQHKLAEKDVEIAHDTTEIKRLSHALDIRQHMMAEKDIDTAQSTNEVRRLNHALDVRQKIFGEKDLQMVEEKKKEARLQAEVDSLNEELTVKSYYVYCLTSALLVAAALLLGIAAYILLDRRNALPSWLANAVAAKQKTGQAQGNNAQTDPHSNGQ